MNSYDAQWNKMTFRATSSAYKLLPKRFSSQMKPSEFLTSQSESEFEASIWYRCFYSVFAVSDNFIVSQFVKQFCHLIFWKLKSDKFLDQIR